jgi:hypothetical protein
MAKRAARCVRNPSPKGTINTLKPTKVASIERVLGLGVKGLKILEPLEAQGLGCLVVFVEMPLPWPVPEEIW